MSAVNDRHLTIKALEMALKRRCPEIGLLHHSDQGCTYASADYQALGTRPRVFGILMGTARIQGDESEPGAVRERAPRSR